MLVPRLMTSLLLVFTVGGADRHVRETTTAADTLEMVTLGGRRYFFSDLSLKLDWRSAQLFCRSRGLQLVSLEEHAENERVKQHLTDNNLIFVDGGGFWLGAQDVGAGLLKWSSSNMTLTFTDWHAHEPNSGEGLLTCVSMWPPLGGGQPSWGMTACAIARKFICEQP